MKKDDLVALLDELRMLGGEPTDIEAKAAAGGLPASVTETASAFANTNGGTLVLGVDERDGFALVPLPDPVKLRDDLVSALSDQLAPPLRPTVDLVEIDGRVVVAAEIDPLPSDQRPCFVERRGMATGCYVRTGDGDRRMTQTEVGLAIANRGQPRYDAEPVPGATIDDLDRPPILRTLERVRTTSRALRDVDDVTALKRLRILSRDDAEVPTLAGLLTFGVFPQQFFPQLTISLVVMPSTTADRSPVAPRFVDNPTIRGAIPDLVAECLAAVRRHLSVRTYVDGDGRRDQLDYPMEAVREAVVNAVLHRDYSPGTRGTQIQVELHPDHLVVRSPGALFGPVTVADLGIEGVSSSRNSFLAQLLSDTYLPRSDRLVAENRASGILVMIRELQRSGLGRPRFDNHPSRFEVRFARSELMDPETRRWLGALHRPGFGQLHELALAMMRHGHDVTNAHLREYGADRGEATRVLGDLVTAGLVMKQGGRRYAWYGLVPEPVAAQPDLFGPGASGSSTTDLVAETLERIGESTAAELADTVGRSRASVLTALRGLATAGRVVAVGAQRSPQRRYVWVR
ncbi:hypothetical protein GCM10009836_56270 [Pseudonocardia ailaonensis]|uniref:Schlafen AlbA-2 domain-containing protein n=1 Tax=Pseudonocardia ailaonensis TaxID=367279 RepID=A0ABN2NGM2_9PSEU